MSQALGLLQPLVTLALGGMYQQLQVKMQIMAVIQLGGVCRIAAVYDIPRLS